MIIFIDFDGVLLNDLRFKDDYVRMFGRFGVSKEAYWCAYQESKLKSGGYYIPEKHLAILKKDNPRLQTAALKRLSLIHI